MRQEFETGPEAKQRAILNSAIRGEFGLKLCAKHYFAHIEGSDECILQTARQVNEFFGIFDESSLRKID
jgi:hypothetical protein